jgi:outer membrane protein OmpA-like peptidoglycan-associated protein
MVVLMPDPEGVVGTVSVSTDAGSVDITEARQATVVTGRGKPPSPPEVISDEKITEIFADAMQSLPEPPQHFILYFKFDSLKLTSDSRALLPKIYNSIERRSSRNIRVVGHTDTSGGEGYNLELSRERAEAITNILINEGVEKSSIQTTSHGEEDLLVETADNVVEPLNRRVEVIVQ